MKPALVLLFALAALAWCAAAAADNTALSGLTGNLDRLYRLSTARSRSISPENFTGEKGRGGMATEGTGKNAARDLGPGWKVSPSVAIKAGTTFTLGEITGPGCIQQIWMTPTGNWRHAIIRFHWDDEAEPSVECPVGDFFACGWGKYAQVNSLAVGVNPGSAFNCQDDLASVAFWYQAEPHRKFPALPAREALDIQPLPGTSPAPAPAAKKAKKG